MSYDLHAYRFAAELSPKQLSRLLRKDDPDERSERLSRDKMERLADALMAVDATAQRHDEGEFIEIDAEAMQVTVDSSGAEITIPYHGLGDRSATTMDRAFEYADVMTAAGLTVWDPQSESIVTDGDEDRAVASRRFEATSDVLREMAEADRPTGAAPRWMFWRR